ncbi:hypothetical protein B484DRAFT_444077 [Ochromonadaceae sp. CCMP2298]|nr:hypothetical protein B484DRAFT_444077 [Ochromonadaceae sp. CCMP2298]
MLSRFSLALSWLIVLALSRTASACNYCFSTTVSTPQTLPGATSSNYVSLGIDVTVTTLAAGDKVLLTANLNLAAPGGAAFEARFTFYRASTNVVADRLLTLKSSDTSSTEQLGATLAYVDTPGPAGTYTYSVLLRGQGVISKDSQPRQLAAIVLPAAFSVATAELTEHFDIVSTTLLTQGIDVTVTPTSTADKVLLLNQAVWKGASGTAAYLNFKRGGSTFTNTLQRMVAGGSVERRRNALQMHLDAPSLTTAITYSAWAGKGLSSNADSSLSDPGTRQLVAIVIPSGMQTIISTSTSALTMSASGWTSTGLSASVTPTSSADKVGTEERRIRSEGEKDKERRREGEKDKE